MRRTNIHLTEKQITILTELSKREGLSMAELIRRAIDQYIEMMKGKYERTKK